MASKHVLAASTRVSVAMICNRVTHVGRVGPGHGCRQLAHRHVACKAGRWQDGGAQRLTRPGGEGIGRHLLADPMKPCSRVWPIVKNQCLLTVFRALQVLITSLHTRVGSSTRHFPHPDRATSHRRPTSHLGGQLPIGGQLPVGGATSRPRPICELASPDVGSCPPLIATSSRALAPFVRKHTLSYLP